jgi:peptide/nickel transport system substrate-binding protein
MTDDSPRVMSSLTRRRFLQSSVGGVAGLTAWLQGWPRLLAAPAAKDEPSGQMTWAIHVTIAPTWFDPAETPGTITPFMLLYALHDAMCKPMPEQAMAPCLATHWQQSPDGLTYDFELRQGVTFHNGDPFTAEDVQYSFERYKGSGNTLLKDKVKAVEIVDPHHVRFHLHEPWPDFMTFYGTPATGAAWIVPKKYLEKVGTDAFKKNPIGLGPYRVVEHQPGVELVLEANTHYWRQVPSVKRIVFKSVPEATTRLAMLKKREADVAYAVYGPLAEEVQRDPSLKLEPMVGQAVQWISFVDQYEPKSPWADKRVRLAASLAFNRQAVNEAEMLGYSVLTGNIIPRNMEYALPLEPYPYDPKRAKALLTEAGYPHGFDAGECSTENVYAPVIEALVNDLGVVGIRAKVRAIERAAQLAAQGEKRVKNLTRQGSGAYGNAATRIEGFMTSTGAQSFLKDAEIDAWYGEQATALDTQKREAILHKIQQKVYDEALFMPIFELGFLCASGPRVAVSGLRRIPAYIYSAPFEEVRLQV